MTLKEVSVKQTYRTSLDSIPMDFYIPLLSRAISYDRAVGFFSSTVLTKIYTGVAALANNGGKIRIVASPKLSENDVKAIKQGYEMRDAIIREAIMRELNEPKSHFEENCLNQLANLIADNVLDIKIAFTEKNNDIGMYHEKMGLITDNEDNTVAFSGSMNESLTAVSLNYESIDVFCSWMNDEQRGRVEDKKAAFSMIWNNNEPDIVVLDFPELSDEIISRYRRKKIERYETYYNEPEYVAETPELRGYGAVIPKDITLHSYQIEAIDRWQQNDFRGIFDMATGTGKTFTGLGALARLCDAVENNLAAIIVCPFQHLVEQWVEDIARFNIIPIIGYSTSSQKNWLKRLDDAIRDQKLHVQNKEFFCFVTTNATFSLDKVQKLITKIGADLLLIIDEAHNFGAEHLSSLLSDRYRYRLALSATLERHNDEEGTDRLYSFFGTKCIEYTLERAIEENKLTRYKYIPILTTLTQQELSIYSQLSYEISKCVTFDKYGKSKLNDKGKILALKRARVVAGASNKLVKLEEYISPYKFDRHILVYCGATNIIEDDQDISNTDAEDIRQIDAVSMLLGNKIGMNVAQFTSRENIQKRELLKREFAAGDTMQVLIAIKCLDEGMNIPKIKTAFILASTTNPKEYIQRRGRVLRLADGKDFAEIYDFITLPRDLNESHSLTEEQIRKELNLVKNEIRRGEEFARLAINMAQAEQIINSVREAYSINKFLFDNKEDYLNA